MKEAYERFYMDFGGVGLKKLKLTGRCKTITGGPYGTRNYRETRCFFGLFTRWVDTTNIEWYKPETVTEYQCGDEDEK